MRRAVTLLLVAAGMGASAAPRPDAPETTQFREQNPCPSNGRRSGTCPGHELDYVVPPCLGGPQSAYNLQWLPTAEFREKARADARSCPATRGSTTS